MKNIFVMGLDEANRQMLETVRGADNYRFHSLLSFDALVHPESYPVHQLLDDARRQLETFDGSVDAIIGHWDFPTTSLLPILRRECGLDGPSLESVLKCENKYWSRIEQERAAPEATPAYQGIDPFDDDAVAKLELGYPFWLKPVVAFSSYLGFRVDDEAEFRRALSIIRDNIGKFAEPFNDIAAFADTPPEVPDVHGGYCIGEALVGGRLCTLEGYVHRGEPVVYDIVDSYRGPNQVSFEHYELPSSLPEGVRRRLVDTAARVMTEIGLDNGPFNIELFWNEDSDAIKILEINPRISKSHSPLFNMVAGASHHEVAIDLALGHQPRFPRRDGHYRVAGKFMPRTYDDATVTEAPSQADIDRVKERFPEALVYLHVDRGSVLSDLPGQDSYSFELGEVFLGGDSHPELIDNFREAMHMLHFRFSRTVATNY